MNMKKRSPVFPKRLYDVLEKAEEGGYDHIISWLPDGSGFKSIMMGRNARKMRIKSYRSSRRPSISHGTNPFCGSYSCTALNVTARGNIVVSANTYSFVAVDENCFTRNLSKIFKLLPWTKLLRR